VSIQDDELTLALSPLVKSALLVRREAVLEKLNARGVKVRSLR
jgi:hypothetical protein